jgi:hypothetical protein
VAIVASNKPLLDSVVFGWSGDPAFGRPDTNDEEDPALKEWINKWRVAGETGDYSPLVAEGATPTLFKFRPIGGSKLRKITDLTGQDAPSQMAELAFRVGLVGISNLDGGPKVERKVDQRYTALGEMASRDVVDFLDGLDVNIVGELGIAIFLRSHNLSKK